MASIAELQQFEVQGAPCPNYPCLNVVQFMRVTFPRKATSLPVLLMERLPMDLKKLMPNIPIRIRVSIMADIARGLIYLHGQ